MAFYLVLLMEAHDTCRPAWLFSNKYMLQRSTVISGKLELSYIEFRRNCPQQLKENVQPPNVIML